MKTFLDDLVHDMVVAYRIADISLNSPSWGSPLTPVRNDGLGLLYLCSAQRKAPNVGGPQSWGKVACHGECRGEKEGEFG